MESTLRSNFDNRESFLKALQIDLSAFHRICRSIERQPDRLAHKVSLGFDEILGRKSERREQKHFEYDKLFN